MKQAANDRNRQKIQKLLYRVKEIKPDKVDVEIVRAERVLRELVEQEEKDIARKELRKATRMSDIPSLEGALLKVKRLKLPEEDGDISAAEEVLQTLRDKRDAALGKTRDKSQQTTDSPAPYSMAITVVCTFMSCPMVAFSTQRWPQMSAVCIPVA